MNLPFTQQQFFEVFARYNEAIMPLQIGLFLLGVSAYGALVVRGRDSDRAGRMLFGGESRARRIAGHALIGYALVAYPLLSVTLGRAYPEIPTFGLPCPTTIFTIGMLAFLSGPLPRYVFAAPIAWALVGAQGAFLLGVYEDLGLLLAALAGVWLAFDPPAQTRPA